MSIAAQRVRVALEQESRDPASDKITGLDPFIWKGVDCRLELACFSNGALVDFSNVSSVTVYAKALSAKTGASILPNVVISSFDNTLDATTWDDGTKQHLVATWTHTETNISLSGADTSALWIAVEATLNDGKVITLGCFGLTVAEDGTSNSSSPAANAPGYYTDAQSDARFMPINGGSNENIRYKAGKGLQTWNPTTGLWHTQLLTGDPPSIAWDAGEA